MVERLIQIILIGLAGGAGTLARFGLTALSHRVLAPLESSPWRAAAGTLAVNVLGSFLFGLLFALSEPASGDGPAADPSTAQIRLIVLVGFMGAFTTFSTFSFDAVRLARDSHWLGAASYLAISVGAGLAGLLAGLALGARRG